MGTEIHTGAIPGRIVWGHPLKSQPKVDQQKQPVIRNGVQVQQWAFGVAFDKAVFQQSIAPMMQAEVATKYPNGTPPQFSWKIKDGDSVDRKGVPYANRPGHAGCIILTVSTEAFAPPVLKPNGAGGWIQMNEQEIKCGDYVALVIDAVVNVPTNASHTPGLYINPKAVIFCGYGEEIKPIASFDPSSIPQVQYQLPPGASLTPTVPQGVGIPGTAPAAQPMPGMVPQPAAQPMSGMVAQPAAQPMPGVEPHPGFIHGAPGVMGQ